MFLEFRPVENGLFLKNKKKNVRLVYPKNIWQSYPDKDVLVDNLAYLLTINMPLISRKKIIAYNTSIPMFKKEFENVVKKSIPHSVESYSNENTEKILKRFESIDYRFKNKRIKKPEYKGKLKEKAIVSFSCGKDSLSSLAISEELGLKPTAVYINDTVSPSENRTKLKFMKQMSKKHRIHYEIINNQIEQINDFELWERPESCLGYTHMVTGFCFISIPLMHYYNSKYIIIGNQQDMNLPFTNKDGIKTYPSYDQLNSWTKKQDQMINKMTSGKGRVMSLIEPLTNIALMKLMFNRYADFTKYWISCDCLNASNETRWCHNCSKCARLGLFVKANGFDPKMSGLHNLFEKKHKQLYTLFDGKKVDNYEKSKESKEQQLLAFYMAYQNGAKGYLIDYFKKYYLELAKKNEDKLHKKFFKIYPATTVPAKLKSKLNSIYKEEFK